MKKRGTIIDVAELAQVSRQTVSRVANNTGGVTEKTRKKVEAAIKELNYSPSSVARALATGRSHFIGMLVIGSAEHGPAAILSSLEVAAHHHSMSVLISVLRGDDISEQHVKEALTQFVNAGVDAVVCIPPTKRTREIIEDINSPVPFITMMQSDNFPEGVSKHKCIAIDQASGIEDGVDHLQSLGHKHILHIPGPEDHYDSIIRRDTLVRICKDRGIKLTIADSHSWFANDAYYEIKRYYTPGSPENSSLNGDLPTAVFTANDLLAIGTLRAFNEIGVNVPKKVSVIGYDNYGGTDCAIPPLTTIEQPFEEVGTICMESVYAFLNDGTPIKNAVVPTSLIVRDSTGKAAR